MGFGAVLLMSLLLTFAQSMIAEESNLAAILEEIEIQAMKLSPKERGDLIHRLILSLEGEPMESPEEIAKAWEEEIARRVADMEAGRTRWIPGEDVFTKLDAIAKKER